MLYLHCKYNGEFINDYIPYWKRVPLCQQGTCKHLADRLLAWKHKMQLATDIRVAARSTDRTPDNKYREKVGAVVNYAIPPQWSSLNPKVTSNVGWICSWSFPLLWEVLLLSSSFPSNQPTSIKFKSTIYKLTKAFNFGIINSLIESWGVR